MTFTAQQLDYRLECGECNITMTPDDLLGHLVEDHEYGAEEAEACLVDALVQADEDYERSLEDYYEDRAYDIAVNEEI